MGRKISVRKPISTEVPQDVVLSPRLYNIYIIDKSKNSTNSEILPYANDTVIITHSMKQYLGARYLQRITDEIIKWSDKWKSKKTQVTAKQ